MGEINMYLVGDYFSQHPGALLCSLHVTCSWWTSLKYLRPAGWGRARWRSHFAFCCARHLNFVVCRSFNAVLLIQTSRKRQEPPAARCREQLRTCSHAGICFFSSHSIDGARISNSARSFSFNCVRPWSILKFDELHRPIIYQITKGQVITRHIRQTTVLEYCEVWY